MRQDADATRRQWELLQLEMRLQRALLAGRIEQRRIERPRRWWWLPALRWTPAASRRLWRHARQYTVWLAALRLLLSWRRSRRLNRRLLRAK